MKYLHTHSRHKTAHNALFKARPHHDGIVLSVCKHSAAFGNPGGEALLLGFVFGVTGVVDNGRGGFYEVSHDRVNFCEGQSEASC